jgi:hypothetical protein
MRLRQVILQAKKVALAHVFRATCQGFLATTCSQLALPTQTALHTSVMIAQATNALAACEPSGTIRGITGCTNRCRPYPQTQQVQQDSVLWRGWWTRAAQQIHAWFPSTAASTHLPLHCGGRAVTLVAGHCRAGLGVSQPTDISQFWPLFRAIGAPQAPVLARACGCRPVFKMLQCCSCMH